MKNNIKIKADNYQKNQQEPSKKTSGHIFIPYTQGQCESVKNICSKQGIQVHFKSGRTIKNLLVTPKDKDTITQKSRVLYRFKFDRMQCDEESVGESARTFEGRFKEYLKVPSLIYEQQTTRGHSTYMDNFSNVERKG